MTTESMLEWLRRHRFRSYCMVCRGLKEHCRMFNHFGGAQYDWKREAVVYPKAGGDG